MSGHTDSPPPLAMQARELLLRVRELEATVARVRELHRPAYSGWCGHCADISDGDTEAMWPCTTVRALDGDQ